jgi:hypothetical protein
MEPEAVTSGARREVSSGPGVGIACWQAQCHPTQQAAETSKESPCGDAMHCIESTSDDVNTEVLDKDDENPRAHLGFSDLLRLYGQSVPGKGFEPCNSKP